MHGLPILPKPEIDISKLRQYRLNRVLAQMAQADVELMVLLNPVSLRYTADWRDYPLYQSRIQVFDLFVQADGNMILHGSYGALPPPIQEGGPSHALNCFDGGLELATKVRQFATDVNELVGCGARIAIEQVNPSVVHALSDLGFQVIDAEPLMEAARYIKSAEEIQCLRYSIAVAESALNVIQVASQPGVTENQLFALLHQINIVNDGEWIDARMLCSGPNTNPWYQMASDRKIENGDLVAIDTDMIGPFGYCADISRTWLVGQQATAQQRQLYQLAHTEITHNATLLKPGRSFQEISERAYHQDRQYVEHRYTCLAHGVGMTDEYPKIAYQKDWQDEGYDGEIEANTVMSVESFVGSDRGGPGVKLEDMYLVTRDGPQRLSTYPFEEALL
ncbi:MAG: Xaa-Pro peptidase family protein [Acidimicrobiia bacterium]|nr:Xaa-Pro peptidase family protein [Acidimicrobiia bacterium]MCY4457426.1 Xaa-Pro peptidase family protein [Acidimicrobiaceae bacterium]